MSALLVLLYSNQIISIPKASYQIMSMPKASYQNISIP